MLEELIAVKLDGRISIRAVALQETLLVEIFDERRILDAETMAAMFVPSAYNLGDGDGVTGTGFLVAKEIVRMHEDYMGLYGGRVEAVAHDGGTLIRFTLPK